jgi:hypothetical protein
MSQFGPCYGLVRCTREYSSETAMRITTVGTVGSRTGFTKKRWQRWSPRWRLPLDRTMDYAMPNGAFLYDPFEIRVAPDGTLIDCKSGECPQPGADEHAELFLLWLQDKGLGANGSPDHCLSGSTADLFWQTCAWSHTTGELWRRISRACPALRYSSATSGAARIDKAQVGAITTSRDCARSLDG